MIVNEWRKPSVYFRGFLFVILKGANETHKTNQSIFSTIGKENLHKRRMHHAKVAKVIVDVPTMQTDQPFTYLVPENLNEQLAVGMRVEVPFGNGNRHVQGFVLAIEPVAATVLDETNVQLKELVAVLDLKPVLNTEMLALADYMKEKRLLLKSLVCKPCCLA